MGLRRDEIRMRRAGDASAAASTSPAGAGLPCFLGQPYRRGELCDSNDWSLLPRILEKTFWAYDGRVWRPLSSRLPLRRFPDSEQEVEGLRR